MTEPASLPAAGEWAELLAAPTVAANALVGPDLPREPGVYLWRHEGQPVYVGMATSLRGRAWSKHLGGGLSLAGSSLRRNVCELLFGIPPSVTSNPNRQKVTAEQAAAIHEWLRSCELSWQSCETAEEADQLERRLRREYMPQLNRN
ncbi:MAG: GIY-YIG nuclease family protein [Microbacteriaceae bacterium]